MNLNINEEDNADNVSENDQNEEQERGGEARVGQNRWCMCGNCVPMVTERESVCCQELQFLSADVCVCVIKLIPIPINLEIISIPSSRMLYR